MSTWIQADCTCCRRRCAWIVAGSAQPQGQYNQPVRCRDCRDICEPHRGECRVNPLAVAK